MFDERGRDEALGILPGAVGANGGDPNEVGDWRTIDRQLRRLATRRSALDAEEARVLIAARRAEVHRHLGLGSFDEHLERVLGYAPTTARDRMRVATALEDLPAIRRALAAGRISFSAVREITRVATPSTERAWLAATDGCTVREIEQQVRGRQPGDHPDDPTHPDLHSRTIRLELTPDGYALFLAARRHLERETGTPMTDSDFMATACHAVLGGGSSTPLSNQPPHRIALTVCAECNRGWQDAAGQSIEVSPGALERARCDATHLGRVDGTAPAPPTRSIPARVRRMVLARDHHRCTLPGCRSSTFVDLHHLRHRADGGDHRPSGLTTLCPAHHAAAHDGRLLITGIAGDLHVTHADGRPYGAPPPSSVEGDRAPAVAHVGAPS